MNNYQKACCSSYVANPKYESSKRTKGLTFIKGLSETSPTPRRRRNRGNMSVDMKDLGKSSEAGRLLNTKPTSDHPTLRSKFLLNISNRRDKSPKNEDCSRIYRTFEPSELREISKSFNKKSLRTAFSHIQMEMSKKNYGSALEFIQTTLNITHKKQYIYLRAVCNMNLKNYEEALKDFSLLKDFKETKSPNLFINIYKCYYHLHNIEQALLALNTCLSTFPNHSQGYFIRGKLLMETENYDLAIKDFQKLKYPQAYIYISHCWKHKNNYEKALKYLKKFNKNKDFHDVYLLEMGKLDYKFGFRDKAMLSLNRMLELRNVNWEAFYYIGKCRKTVGKLEEAEFMMEKAAKNKENAKIADRAIFHISKLRLEENDFYGAHNALKRIKNQWVSKSKALHVKMTEAMYCILQNKLIDSVKLLSELLQENNYGISLRLLTYRAFCYFCLKKYSLAVKDYEKAESNGILDAASAFNYKVSIAMIEFIVKNYQAALELLKPEDFKNYSNQMWRLMRVHCYILNSTQQNMQISEANKELRYIKKAQKGREFYVLSSYCFYCIKNFDSSFEQVEKSINLLEKNSFLAYAIKGFCYVFFKCYSEAYDEFASALAMNKSLNTLYAYRGLCAFFAGHHSKAVEDFLKIYELNDPNAPLLSVYLLVVCQSYDKALNLLENIPKTTETTLVKAHCSLLLEKFDNCLLIMSQIQDVNMENDIFIINSLQQNSFKTIAPGIIFNEKYTLWVEGLQNFYQKDYESARRLFEIVIHYINNPTKDLVFNDNTLVMQERCEVLYNIALCCIFQDTNQSLSHASVILNRITSVLSTVYSHELLLLSSVVEISLGNKSKAQEILEKLAKGNKNMCDQFLNNEEMELRPFNTNDGINTKIPLIRLPDQKNVQLRPIIKLPILQPPLEFNDSIDVLNGLVKMEGVSSRPEVPWLSKVDNKYVFTDNLIEDIESCASEKRIDSNTVNRCRTYSEKLISNF